MEFKVTLFTYSYSPEDTLGYSKPFLNKQKRPGAFHPSAWKAQVGEFLSSMSAWSIWRVTGKRETYI